MKLLLAFVLIAGSGLVGWNLWKVRHPVPYMSPVVSDGWPRNFVIYDNIITVPTNDECHTENRLLYMSPTGPVYHLVFVCGSSEKKQK